MVFRLAFSIFFVSSRFARGITLEGNAGKGIILSGGYNGEVDYEDEVFSGLEVDVEVFVPSTGLTCSLPSLPDGRQSHTMDGLYICGGSMYPSIENCIHFSSGEWYISHSLAETRSGHSSWQTDQGIFLMGGFEGYTSEFLPTTGEQGGQSFPMEHETRYTCAIQLSDSVIMTGGGYTEEGMNMVARYGIDGFMEDLPSLVVGRKEHGCGSYLREDGTQVLLVAGGMDLKYNLFSSTEVLTSESTAWTLTTPLPSARMALRGVSVDNRVYMTGGENRINGEENYMDDILEWLDEEQEWVLIGKMKMSRSEHGASTIELDDEAMEYCCCL